MNTEYTKIASLGLTPDIKSNYADFSLLDGIPDHCGYFTFKAKSKMTGETHHIRAFNLNSSSAQQNHNQATTLFLKETLRLSSIHPETIIQDTFEFRDSKICYALKPMYSLLPSSPNPDVFNLLKDLTDELKSLSKDGYFNFPLEKIY